MQDHRARIMSLVFAGLLAAGAATGAAAREPTPAGTQPASPARAPLASEPGVWKEQDLQFDYLGFTMHYSCSGLRERMLLVLRLLGARAEAGDVAGCGDYPRAIERFPYVRARFATFVPADPSAAATVPGQWRSVDLVGLGKLDANECELMEQIIQQVLPRFAVRNIGKPANCVPHQETRTEALRLDVFGPLAQAAP